MVEITVTQLANYFRDKENVSTPIYDALVRNGLRKELLDYRPSNEINNDILYGGQLDDYIHYAKRVGLKEAPTQYWHIMESYCKRKKQLGQEKVFQFSCIELLAWMAEVSKALAKEEIDDMVETKIANPRSRSAIKPYWDKIIAKIISETD